MINLQNVNKQYGSKVLYRDMSGALNPVHRTGLVGPNGAGKTVLLRILVGEDSVDSGELAIPPGLRLGYLPQEMTFEDAVNPLDCVLRPFESVLDADAVFARLAEEQPGSDEYRKAEAEMIRLHAEVAIHDAYRLEARAKSILAGLGVPRVAWERDMRELSGGYRMRVVLAQLLLVAPDYLLLDEPTNHLDMDSLVWLEKFLGRFAGGMLVVSHDRDFLDRVTTHTAELGDGSLQQLNTPVGAFLEWKQQRMQSDRNRTENIARQISNAEAFVRRFKAKNTKAAQARSKLKQIERLKEELPPVAGGGRTLRFQLPQAERSGNVPLRLEGLTVGYGGEPVLSNVSLTVSRGDKIAVIGPNGAGKSTLLKTCAGLLTPSNGSVVVGHNATVRYYSQHRLEQLDPSKTLLETVTDKAGAAGKTYIQSILGAFMFSNEEVLKPVSVLSGGEKSRLSLARILADPGNVLLLDEPTNHLDVETVERLADVLDEFEGTIVMVSHDEYFVSRIADRIVEVRPGSIRDFPGALDDYRSYLEAGLLPPVEPEGQGPGTPTDKEERIRERAERKKLMRRIEKIERDLQLLESRMETTKGLMHDPANARDFTKLQDADVQLSAQQKQYDRMLLEWEQLQEKAEAR